MPDEQQSIRIITFSSQPYRLPQSGVPERQPDVRSRAPI
jgi:hypothetical protein